MKLPTLPARPKAEVLTVGDILAQAQAGRLRVPSFQTGLRWKVKQVEELFDSILRGFPIGGLLLWQREAAAEQLAFGPLRVDAPACADARFIVDGQQRVTALVGALLHPDEPPLAGTHALWLNLLEGSFSVLRKQPVSQEGWLPLNIIGERRRLQHWARAASYGEQTDEIVDRAFRIEETIIRYELPAYIVRNADEPALRLIFSRVNHSGVPLNEPEVFQALFGSEGESKPITALATELNHETGFGQLPEAWLLRCLKAIAELNPKLRFTEDRPPPDELLAHASTSMRAAIRFLQHEVGFLHASVLPYRFPLIILARFFHCYPKPAARSRTLLTRWIWRGALAKLHGNSSHANVASHLDDIGDDEHESIQRLLARVPKRSKVPSAIEKWNGQAASTRLHAACMLAAHPIDPGSGQAWTVVELLGWLAQLEQPNRHIGEFFRRPLAGTNPEIAARVFLPKSQDDLSDASEEVLHSLAIEGVAADAVRRGDADAFVSARVEFLDARLARLIELRAAPDESDRPPIRKLTG
ncbi:DUF262 domain-containing protein [Enhygromyxa salina]|uniref:GmrSD restriction endonucleases N-terminal domain-containing protein n=1 Tax=Enhygromyxa salina TaxID=215803 RepID=A0A2S9YM95_9BACT|nr:DUF262 domain-containing protein [Enhygromyxa salina]PRQ06214.1 hypothetical protein ENSA7_40620 [Enhygromyxa salina]